VDQPLNFYQGWTEVPDAGAYDNAFKVHGSFLRHVALGEPFRWTLREGAKGVQLAEAGLRSDASAGSISIRSKSLTHNLGDVVD